MKFNKTKEDAIITAYFNDPSNIIQSVWGARLRKPIRCTDGFRLSVQASDRHHCFPQELCLNSYESYECGYPSEPEVLLDNYRHESKNPEVDVYFLVPWETVDEIIEKHGGLA